MATVTVHYAGQRVAAGNKLAHLFVRDDTNDDLLFTPKKDGHWIIGAAYPIEHKGESSYLLPLPIERDKDVAEHRLTSEWRALAATAREHVAGVKARASLDKEAKAENRDIGDLTLDELARLYRRRLPDQRAALVTAILRHLDVV